MPTIVLDPGHGGSDSGAANGNFHEKTFNLNTALRVRNYLQQNYEVDIIMTRTTDTAVSLPARTNQANRANADYYCSIHTNAGGGTGWESYIYSGSVSNQTVKAQQTIHNYVMSRISRFGIRNRGTKRENFHVLRTTSMPAILLENLFIDTNFDLNLLRNESFMDTLGEAIGEGLARALSLKKLPSATKLYIVIAGSFGTVSNAETRRNMLRANGVEAFVTKTKVDGKTMYRVQAGAFRNRDLAEVRQDIVQNIGISDAFITTK